MHDDSYRFSCYFRDCYFSSGPRKLAGNLVNVITILVLAGEIALVAYVAYLAKQQIHPDNT